MDDRALYLMAADAILVAHVLFVVFVILGLVLILVGGLLSWGWVRNPWFRYAHLAAIGFVVLQSWLGAICPLTIWEMALREKAGDAVYAGAFVAHWLESILYYQAPQWVFAVCYTAFGLLVAAAWFRVRPRKHQRARMYDESFWNKRYAGEHFVYGTEPNSFLAEHCDLLTGPVLSLSEGEGRNAVFLASRGLDVLGVDISGVALEKAGKLAQSRGVKIRTAIADLASYEPEENHYGSVVSISAHLPGAIRKRLYPLIERSLRPGGVIVLEAYSENQLSRNTGGPKDVDLLMTVEKIRREFPNLEPLLLREVERDVSEGEGHTGLASVIQFVGKRRA
jgi:SAM-dependent methyltransferase